MTIHRLPAPKGGRAPNYRMAAKADRGEVYLYDIIGAGWLGGISAKQFAKDLKALGAVKTIDVRINSDGGDVFDGRAMYTLLAEHPARIVVHVDGLAASIAALIAMAGDEVRMAEGTMLMIHNAWGLAIGEAKEMRQTADLLDSVSATIRDTMAKRSGNTPDDVQAWMDAETWMTADVAKDRGFADVVTGKVKAAAMVRDLVHAESGYRVAAATRFKHIPAALRPNRAAALSIIRGEKP
jgi:ATP-dependent Clp protease protease subunit